MARKRKSQGQTEEATAEEAGPGMSQDLYSVLGVERNSSQDVIKKAYHRMALRLHPDKNPGDESAKDKFQMLQHVFSILGDPEKRKVYDRTGSTDDADLESDKFKSFYDYYRAVHREVTAAQIEQFEQEYRGSKEEAKDLKELYTRFKGKMSTLFLYMICSRPETDSHRFRDLLEAAITAGDLKPTKAFKQWAAEVAKTPPPSNPINPPKKAKQAGSEADLAAIIQRRGAERADSLLANLAEKYGEKENKGGKGSGKGRKLAASTTEPSEEEFQKLQRRITMKSSRK